MFKKFKDKEKFIKLVNQFNVHKSPITVEINIYKLCEKYSKLMKSSIGLDFLKDIKDIKDITKILKKFVIKTKRSLHNDLLSSYHLFSLGWNELRKIFKILQILRHTLPQMLQYFQSVSDHYTLLGKLCVQRFYF